MRDQHQLKFFANLEPSGQRVSHGLRHTSHSKSPFRKAGTSPFHQSPPKQRPSPPPAPAPAAGPAASANDNGDRRLHIRVEKSTLSSGGGIAVPSAALFNGKELNYQELCHIAWNAFDLMVDAQRNAFLKGLLLRCDANQIDCICTTLNLRHTGVESLTQLMFPADAHSKLVRMTTKKLSGARGRSAERCTSNFRSPDRENVRPTGQAVESQRDNAYVEFDKDMQTLDSPYDHEDRDVDGLVNANMYLKLVNGKCDYNTLTRQLGEADVETIRHLARFLSTRCAKLHQIINSVEVIATENDIDKVLSSTLDCLLDVTNARFGTLYVIVTGDGQVTCRKSNWLQQTTPLPISTIVGGEHLVNGDLMNVYGIKATDFYDEQMDSFYTFDLNCFLSGPVFVGGSNSAIIELAGKKSGSPFFSAEDEAMFKAMLSVWSVLLRNSDVQLDTGHKADDIAELLTSASMMSSERSLNDLIQTIMQQSRELLNAERCTLFMVDKDRQELWSTVAQGTGEIRIPLSKGIAGTVATTGVCLNIKNAYEDPRFNREVDIKSGFHTRTILSYPLRNSKGEVIGVTQVINKLPKERKFNREDELLLSAFSALASATIEKSVHFGILQGQLNALKELKDRLATTLMSIDSIVIGLAENGQVEYINHPEILGISSEELLSKSFAEWLVVRSDANASLLGAINRSRHAGVVTSLMEGELHLGTNGPTLLVNFACYPHSAVEGSDGGGKSFRPVTVVIEVISPSERCKRDLARKLPPEVAEKAVLSGDPSASAGTIHDITVLYADVRNYTATAEFLEPPDTVKQLNEFFTAIHTAVDSQGGMLDRYIGDGALGVFGPPFPNRADPINAVHAALHVRAEVEAVNKKRRLAGVPTFKFGIGITTGALLSGRIGSAKRPEYTVIGPAVNIAFRVEAATREYGCCILICDTTRNLVKDQFHLREVDRVMARGAAKPITLYEVFDKSTTELETDTETAIICFELGLGEYRQQNWEGALSNFGRAVQLLDDGPSKTFIERCRLLMDRRTTFPDQWDGVYNRSISG